MKKICFIDRDGTILIEPENTEQINGLEQLKFLPNVISSLKKLSENGWFFVMVTNQDGLGTLENPLQNYELINQKLLEILSSEGIEFLEIFSDDSYAKAPSNNRKPNTGMVDEFLRKNSINYEKSFMVGDRKSDIDFAKNIGIKGFLLGKINWKEIADEVINSPRKITLKRVTKETNIAISLNLDGTGQTNISTGLNFFDHMLEQIGKHANFDLDISCKGDLQVDEHHTVEDVALLFGEALKKALDDKRGITRFSSEKIIIMDESKSEIALDLAGRPFLVFSANFTREYVGDFPTELLQHFFNSFTQKSDTTLHMEITGENNHHMIEVAFKSFGKILGEAVKKNSNSIPSTKGVL